MQGLGCQQLVKVPRLGARPTTLCVGLAGTRGAHAHAHAQMLYLSAFYSVLSEYFLGYGAGHGKVPTSTQVILSHHNYEETPGDEVLEALVEGMFQSGADIAKLATMPQRIEHSARMLALPGKFAGRLPLQPLSSKCRHVCTHMAQKSLVFTGRHTAPRSVQSCTHQSQINQQCIFLQVRNDKVSICCTV